MDAERPRGDAAHTNREPAAPSGWVTTGVAAKSLGVSPRTVRWHIERRNLVAKAEGEGVRRSWLVSIDSLQKLRDSRQVAAPPPGGYRAEAEGADIAADSPGNAIRELADRLVEEASRVSEFRVRLELSERAESTLREELAEERRRREEAERWAEDLHRELEALREPREVPVSPGPSDIPTPAPEEAQEAGEPPRDRTNRLQLELLETRQLLEDERSRPRSWWRRLFDG